MSRRHRRLPAVLLPLLLATTLVACGDDTGSDGGDSSDAGGLHGITIKGDIGSEPKVTWDGDLDVDKTETTTVTKGDGHEIKDGDKVQAYLWIGNGTTQEKAYSDYDNGAPETVTASDSLSEVFRDAILGQTIGSRVAVTTTAEDAFGTDGNTSLGIGNKDTVLLIVDLIEDYIEPEAKEVSPSKLPSVIEKGGTVTGLDFSNVAKPDSDGDLLRAVLKKGSGKTVKATDTVKVNYLGSVYQAKKPFDESYSGDPATFSLSSVVQGWTYGLAGLKVGSRVVLQIPPELGYGSTAQKGIPADSTLYFVVDILSAEKSSS